MRDIDIKRMEELGIADYYLDLNKFIHNFINKNYPLDEEDIRELANDKETPNILTRKELSEVMNNKLSEILEYQAIKNQQFLKDLEQGKPVVAINIEQYKKEIFDYTQSLLEALYNYNNTQKEGTKKR